MDKDLLLVLEDINKKINKIYSGRKRDSYNKQIAELLKSYESIEIQEKHEPTYKSLVSKGKELLRDANIKDEKKLSYYLRYCNAAEYDFKDNIKPLNLILKSFLLTSALFFVLSPQYFGFVLAFIFIIPIFLGLRGMRKRVMNGLMMGVAVVPMGLLVSIIWLRNAFLTMGNFNQYIAELSQQYGFTFEFTKNLQMASTMMSVVLLGSSITLLYAAIKYRKMFV